MSPMITQLTSRSRRGFTLIELLVVVAIIAILAAIAVPNFLNAVTRSRLSRARADMRTIVLGLESYHVDHKAYPEDYAAAVPVAYGMGRLTSPIAYIAQVPEDPFGGYLDEGRGVRVRSFSLGTEPDERPTRWAMASVGPDGRDDTSPLFGYPGYRPYMWENPDSGYKYFRYDPTNGTISKGDLILVSDQQPE